MHPHAGDPAFHVAPSGSGHQLLDLPGWRFRFRCSSGLAWRYLLAELYRSRGIGGGPYLNE